MVYLEIWVCRLGFWGPNVDGIYFSPLALLLKPNISVNKTKDAFFLYILFYLFSDCVCRAHVNCNQTSIRGYKCIAKSNLAHAR